jgi:D-psicose/D-tagatose/L-ribulose 3-epimerase
MKHAVHLALWMTTWSEDVLPHLERAAALGFDGAELSLLGMDDGTVGRIRSRASELGLGLTCTTGLAPHQDVSSADADVRAEGVRTLEGALRTVHALGADLGVRLGVEAINRYETDLVTTAALAARLARDVDHPQVGVLLDTYHMNIEEKDVAAAIGEVGPQLFHLHVVEHDRGVPGSGHLPWDDVARGVAAAGYDGWATLEMFVVPDVDVSADLTVWRAIERDPTEAARAGLRFLRERFR